MFTAYTLFSSRKLTSRIFIAVYTLYDTSNDVFDIDR